jgi:hypothetical protein
VNNIMIRVHTHHKDILAVDQLVQYSKNCYFTGVGPLNEMYRNLFCLVDVADGYWYASAESHKFHEWSGKFMISVLKFFINNTWCLACSEKATKLDVFRAKVADLFSEWE